MRIIYVLRRSREWAEGRRNGPYWYGIERFVDWWNWSFPMSYGEFRAGVSEIRASGVDLGRYDAVVEPWHPNYHEVLATPGSLLVGCDEDDWIDPDTPDVLRKLGKVDVPVRWDFTLYQGAWANRLRTPFEGSSHEYMSCNYALPTPVADPGVMSNHGKADIAFRSGPEIYLPMGLSVQNRTPASTSLMKERVKNAGDLVRLMSEWLGDVEFYGIETPAYCMPLIKEIQKLCRRAVSWERPVPVA